MEPKNNVPTQPVPHICSCTPSHCQRQQHATCAADLADQARQNQQAERAYRQFAATGD